MTLVPDAASTAEGPDRHAHRRRRHRRAPRGGGRGARRVDARSRRALAAGGLRLHRRVPARQGGPARRAPRHHALGQLRRSGRALSGRLRRARPDLRARRQRRHLGGRDRRAWTWRWRSSRRTSAARSRSTPRASWSCSCSARAARRSSAPSSPRRPPTARRCESCRPGSPTTWTRTSRCRRSPGARSMSERNFARAFRRETGMTPARLRGGGTRRERAHRARDRRPARRGRRPPGRLRHRRDDATGLPAPGRA